MTNGKRFVFSDEMPSGSPEAEERAEVEAGLEAYLDAREARERDGFIEAMDNWHEDLMARGEIN